MESGSNSSKSIRGYGDFISSSTASSLFDSAPSRFLSSRPKRRFQKALEVSDQPPPPDDTVLPSVSDRVSPAQVFSPPISLPESCSTDGNVDDGSESDTELDSETMDNHFIPSGSQSSSQSSTASINRSLCATQLASPEKKEAIVRRRSPFDFPDDNEEVCSSPAMKRTKNEEPASKFMPPKKNKPVYQHKWAEDDEEEENKVQGKALILNPKMVAGAFPKHVPIYARARGSRVRNVKEAHQCLESGEHDDFKHDLEYALSSIREGGDSNVKCLSILALGRKCISSEFRQFIRSECQVNLVFRAMADAAADEDIAVCAATVIYLMSRDFVPLSIDGQSIKLLSQILKFDKNNQGKYNQMVWDVLQGYIKRWEQSNQGRKLTFDWRKDKLSASNLILESLVFILVKVTVADDSLKTELLNLGILQFVVSKVEKIVLLLIHDKPSQQDIHSSLVVLERCFRILESCTVYHKKNQAFLISHRAGLLIQVCGKLMGFIQSTIVLYNTNTSLTMAFINCLILMNRLLINLSHESELCSTKLGQIPDFLTQCLMSVTFICRKFAPCEKRYDLLVMSLSLIVNLVERCSSNRRKVLESTVTLFDDDEKETSESCLNALTKLFALHEFKARSIDEDLDKDLAFEEPVDVEDDIEKDDSPADGRLDRAKLENMSESEFLNAVSSVMGKASDVMEDTILASYIALLIGCLLQQNEEQVEVVRQILPGRSLGPMVDQLQRLHAFMSEVQTSGANKNNGIRSIERIIDLMESF